MKKCAHLKLKLNGLLYCKVFDKEIPKTFCYACKNKEFKHNKPTKRTKALGITKKTKLAVWERDNHRCIFCGKLVPWNNANSHFIKRSQGGLGIERNILTNCEECHHKFDDTPEREVLWEHAERYLMSKYKDFDIDSLTYKKN